MKKLTLTFVLLLILGAGYKTHADPCGHQHAERCLAEQPTSGEKVEDADYKSVILKTLPGLWKILLPF